MASIMVVELGCHLGKVFGCTSIVIITVGIVGDLIRYNACIVAQWVLLLFLMAICNIPWLNVN